MKQPTPARGAPNVTFRNQGDGKAEVLLYDSIGAGWFGGIGADEFARELRALGDVSTIYVRINSDGGDVFQGIAIANQLKRHTARIEVSIDGLAASIASVIAMAGDSISIADNAYMMIHNPWGFAAGEADELRRVAGTLDDVAATIRKTYENRTGRESWEVVDWMNAETWMDAETTVDRGFADQVDLGAAQLAASIHDGWFRKVPAALTNATPPPMADVIAETGAASKMSNSEILTTMDCVMRARGLRSIKSGR